MGTDTLLSRSRHKCVCTHVRLRVLNSYEKRKVLTMRKIAYDRGMRLSKRIVKLHTYLRDEAQEEYLAEKILKHGSMIGACMIRLGFSKDNAEYIDNLHDAMVNTVKTLRWLNIIYDRGFIEYQTYLSLSRECDELINILMRKTSALMDDLEM